MASRTTWYILVLTFVVSGLLLIVGTCSAWFVHRVNREVSDSLDTNLAAAQATERFVLAIRDLRLQLERFANTGDVRFLEPPQLVAALQRLDADFDRFEAYGWPAPPIPAVIEQQLRQCRETMVKLRPRLTALDRMADLPARRTDADSLVLLITDGLLAPAEQLLDYHHQAAQENSRRNLQVANRIGLGLFLLGICGAVAGMLIGFGIARSVHRSLVQSQQETLRNEQLAAVGQLAAGLAHEIRNPLMSMKLIVQMAADKLNGDGSGGERNPAVSRQPFRSRDLAVLEEEITRLEKMLQTFLDFARPPKPTKGDVCLNELVESILSIVRPRSDQQDIAIHAPPGDAAVCHILADPSQLRQVLLNLVLNAMDALPDGGEIWIEWSESDTMAKIRVSDNGVGLPADDPQRIFEPFVSTKTTGIGLGLTVCRRIVESHGGRIAAGNRPEGGAAFTVWLPLR